MYVFLIKNCILPHNQTSMKKRSKGSAANIVFSPFIFASVLTLLFIGSCKKEVQTPITKLKITVHRATHSLQNIEKISAVSSPKGNCYYAVYSIMGYLSLKPGADIETLYSVAASIEDYFTEFVGGQFTTHLDAVIAYNVAQQYAYTMATSAGLDYEPLGGPLDDPAEQVCPGDDGFVSVVDPCAQKALIKEMATNSTISQKNNELKNKTSATNNPSGIEYGVQFKLNSLNDPAVYKTATITTGNIGTWNPQPFVWNSSEGYSIGESHTHIDGQAHSPVDIFDMAKNLAIVNNTGVGVQFYKKNVTMTIVTQWGNWVATVKDWPLFLKEYEKYKKQGSATYNANYLQIGNGALSPPGTKFLTKFGAFLNLYKADPNSNEYNPLKLNTNGSPEIIYCPD